MEVVNKLVGTTKRLCLEEEDLREELIQLKTEVLAEEANLVAVKESRRKLVQENSLLEQSIEFANTNTQLMVSFQNMTKSSIMLHSFLQVFTEKAEPSDGQQSEMLTKLKANYAKMLEKYESTPTYKAILEEETLERDLCEKIEEKRKKIQKLSEQL